MIFIFLLEKEQSIRISLISYGNEETVVIVGLVREVLLQSLISIHSTITMVTESKNGSHDKSTTPNIIQQTIFLLLKNSFSHFFFLSPTTIWDSTADVFSHCLEWCGGLVCCAAVPALWTFLRGSGGRSRHSTALFEAWHTASAGEFHKVRGETSIIGL